MRPQDCTLLLVDDEEANLDLLEAILREDGYEAIVRTMDSRRVPALMDSDRPDIVLLDLYMPYRDGFAVLRDLRERAAPGDFLPVLVLTADATPEAKERALSSGARDFLVKPLDAVEVCLRVHNLLATRLLYQEQRAGREAAEALARENALLFAEAREATLARERVLSVVAHDLRNPLASIAVNAEMLRHLLPPRASVHQREALASVEMSARRMHDLVEDLLEVSRLEHGSFSVMMRPVSPISFLAEAEAMLRPLAEARGVDLSFEGPRDAPTVMADARRIVQVLSNLIGNALRFTPAGGGVAVSWRSAADELLVSVRDDGPGIPPDLVPMVFGAFWQGSGTGEGRGVGLGLAIARAIVDAHGGRIWPESRAGEGATFHFTLPHATESGADSGQPANLRATASVDGD